MVFLHGFLGCKEDWDPLMAHLSLKCHALDLPGHGSAPFVEDFIEAIASQCTPSIFVGYSLGGRLILMLKERYPELVKAAIILSSHPGLDSEEEKAQRILSDQSWARQLDDLPTFLKKWYAQPLFKNFKPNYERRLHNDPKALKHVLTKYSLGNQKAYRSFEKTLFLYGEDDIKFAQLYAHLGIGKPIEGCSHAIHLENPKRCAEEMITYVENL